MLSEEDQALFFAARGAQVNRNTAIHIFERGAGAAAGVLAGSIVRVLMMMPSRHGDGGRGPAADGQSEDYVLARVEGTVDGVPYSGFSTDSAQETRTYLMLSLPRQLAALNGDQFQLNSVSNSTMSEGEFATWLAMLREDGTAPPTVDELHRTAAHIRPIAEGLRRSRYPAYSHHRGAPPPSSNNGNHQNNNNINNDAAGGGGAPGPYGGAINDLHSHNTAAGRLSAAGSPSAAGAQQQQQQRQLMQMGSPQQGFNDATYRGGGGGGGSASPPSSSPTEGITPAVPLQPAAAPVAQNESEDQELERRLRHDIMTSLQTDCLLFPRKASTYRLSQLRIVERDMIEYLQNVREAIRTKQENCVICMDHLPTVILLPCKHTLCRLCAPTQAACPVCRQRITEMFEPQEI